MGGVAGQVIDRFLRLWP